VIKKIFFLILFFSLEVNLFAQEQDGLPKKPDPARFINDFTTEKVLNPSEKQELETKLRAYYDSTSTQIAVILVDSVGQFDISEYAIRTGKKWGIGQNGKNNGILLVITFHLPHKFFTTTGYGLEGSIPDGTLRIIEQRHLVPNLKTKNYFKAIDETTNALAQAAAGEFKADPNQNANQGGGMSLGLLIPIILIGLLFVFRLFRNRGGRGGGIMSAIPFLLFNGGGSSGGSNFGGGGGGGGFNFGGGDFGGGGAGGSW